MHFRPKPLKLFNSEKVTLHFGQNLPQARKRTTAENTNMVLMP